LAPLSLSVDCAGINIMGTENPYHQVISGDEKHRPGDAKSEYETILKDIEETFGIVPGFMKALPQEVLVHDWPLWKKYTLEQTAIPGKYRELGGLAVAANIKCPYCQLMHTAMAQFHGATQEELAEEYYLASLTARQMRCFAIVRSACLC